MVVMLSPFINFISCLINCSEPVLVKAFVSELAVQAFNECILCRFAGLNKVQLYLALFTPEEHGLAGKLRAVITDNRFG